MDIDSNKEINLQQQKDNIIKPDHTIINKSVKVIKNMEIHNETLNMTLEKLIGILNEKTEQRNSISSQIEELAGKENLFFQNKKTLTDMKFLLEKYVLNPELDQNKFHSDLDKNYNFHELITYFKSVDQNCFLNIYERYKDHGSHKAPEGILKESKDEIEKLKNTFELTFQKSEEENKHCSFNTLKKLIFHKFKLIEEQNNLINCLINYFYCLPEDAILQKLVKIQPQKSEDHHKNTLKSNKVVSGLFLNKAKQEKRRQVVCRDKIVEFLNESQPSEVIQKKNEFKHNKLNLLRENMILSSENQYINNDKLFLKDVINLKMEDLIIFKK